MTNLEESECLLAITDLLQGRIDELTTIYCARDHNGKRKASFSDDCADLLGRIDDMLAEAKVAAERHRVAASQPVLVEPAHLRGQ